MQIWYELYIIIYIDKTVCVWFHYTPWLGCCLQGLENTKCMHNCLKKMFGPSNVDLGLVRCTKPKSKFRANIFFWGLCAAHELHVSLWPNDQTVRQNDWTVWPNDQMVRLNDQTVQLNDWTVWQNDQMIRQIIEQFNLIIEQFNQIIEQFDQMIKQFY